MTFALGNQVIEEEAVRVVEDGLRAVFGGSLAVAAHFGGQSVRAGKRAVALAIGSGGRVMDVEVQGWGPSFEASRLRTQVVVDLKSAKDDLIVAVLRQASSLIRFQNMQSARAAALSISRPLSKADFADLRRLRIDVDAAGALHRELRSDTAVRTWLVTQLGRRWDRPSSGRIKPILQVQGVLLAVPFLLGSVRITEVATPRVDQPCWIDNEVRLLRPANAGDEDMRAAGEKALARSHLRERIIIGDMPWPPGNLAAAATGWARHAAGHPLTGGRLGEPLPVEWRVILERRSVGVLEAFG